MIVCTTEQEYRLLSTRQHAPCTITLPPNLTKVGSLVASLLKVGGECSLLMVLHPVGRAAVVVVGEHLMVVHVQT